MKFSDKKSENCREVALPMPVPNATNRQVELVEKGLEHARKTFTSMHCQRGGRNGNNGPARIAARPHPSHPPVKDRG